MDGRTAESDRSARQELLVSAAAGSGKTAVLVDVSLRDSQRKNIRGMWTGLLIVTFTEAAAAEMKERIGAAP